MAPWQGELVPWLWRAPSSGRAPRFAHPWMELPGWAGAPASYPEGSLVLALTLTSTLELQQALIQLIPGGSTLWQRPESPQGGFQPTLDMAWLVEGDLLHTM